MGIIRSGDSEYDWDEPNVEEKTAKWEDLIREELKKDPAVFSWRGKFLTSEDAEIISRSEQVQSVRDLDLGDNQIGNPGLRALYGSANLRNLESLNLSVNFISDEGVREMAAAESFTLNNLKSLSLEDNSLTDSAIAELIKSPCLAALTSLNLGYNEAGAETAKALEEGGSLKNLRALMLERSYIDDSSIVSLANSKSLAQLEKLDMTSNKLGDEGVKLLATSPTFSHLRILLLNNNNFGDAGAKALGESTTLDKLTELQIGRNSFTNAGADAVYNSKTLTNLKTLVLKEGAELTPGLVNYSRPELLAPPGEE